MEVGSLLRKGRILIREILANIRLYGTPFY